MSLHSFVIKGYNSLTLSVALGQQHDTSTKRKDEKVSKYSGLVLGTQMGLQQYDDGYTKNLIYFDFNFGYNTALGIRPEIMLTSYHHLRGEEMGGFSISGGLAFELLHGYLLPTGGGMIGVYAPWADDQYNTIKGVYIGAGLQYPNTGRFRIKFSTLAHLWIGRRVSSFSPMSLDLGAFYFFGKPVEI